MLQPLRTLDGITATVQAIAPEYEYWVLHAEDWLGRVTRIIVRHEPTESDLLAVAMSHRVAMWQAATCN